jgi:RimJ/RimL family protein N-acetyltransferase
MDADVMTVVETERLALRHVEPDDAPFILELLNEPGWLRYIGDKGVHSIADAHRYLESGPLDMYRRLGFGLYLVRRKSDSASIGLCGLIKRDALEFVDIGFAFLARVGGQGYAIEAAHAMLLHAQNLGLQRLMAITTIDNYASQKVLHKLGMHYERQMRMPNDSEPLSVYAMDLKTTVQERNRATVQ